jgi:hypothetical protein
MGCGCVAKRDKLDKILHQALIEFLPKKERKISKNWQHNFLFACARQLDKTLATDHPTPS